MIFFNKVLKALWGELSKDELKKLCFLSLGIMLIFGNYWMLRITKDPIFDEFVGYKQWQPRAKQISLIAMIFIVLGYSKLVDIFKKQTLLYILCSIYGVLFLLVGFFISNPTFFSISPSSIFYPVISWIPGKLIGWSSYIIIESYGSIMVALFYSFIASIINNASFAKKGYGLIAFVAQLGAMSSVVIIINMAKYIELAHFYYIGSVIIFLVPLTIWTYVQTFPEDAETTASFKKNRKKTGFFGGLKLILKHPYIMGIFIVITSFEIMSIIVEYQMNWIAVDMYPDKNDLTVFRGYQALGISFLAVIFTMFGTSCFMRKFGLKFCLTSYPIAIAIVLSIVYIIRLAGVNDFAFMWILLLTSVTIKGLNYSLNKPTGEVLYVPTDKDVKFKAKGWIDVFGNRMTKGVGSTITGSLNQSFFILLSFGTIISLGIIGVWVFIAILVGNKFEKLQKDKTIIS